MSFHYGLPSHHHVVILLTVKKAVRNDYDEAGIVACFWLEIVAFFYFKVRTSKTREKAMIVWKRKKTYGVEKEIKNRIELISWSQNGRFLIIPVSIFSSTTLSAQKRVLPMRWYLSLAFCVNLIKQQYLFNSGRAVYKSLILNLRFNSSSNSVLFPCSVSSPK